MIIPIVVPVGRSYTCTISGRAYRGVKCGKCGSEYLYQMERKVTGNASSFLGVGAEGAEQRARESALRMLEHGLSKDCELVPCPDCGHYQADMIRKIKTRRFLFAFAAWAFLCLAAWIMYITNDPDSAIDQIMEKFLPGLIVLVLVLAGVGIRLVLKNDPNRNAASRVSVGKIPKSRAIRRANFEATIARQAAHEGESQLVDVPPVGFS